MYLKKLLLLNDVNQPYSPPKEPNSPPSLLLKQVDRLLRANKQLSGANITGKINCHNPTKDKVKLKHSLSLH